MDPNLKILFLSSAAKLIWDEFCLTTRWETITPDGAFNRLANILNDGVRGLILDKGEHSLSQGIHVQFLLSMEVECESPDLHSGGNLLSSGELDTVGIVLGSCSDNLMDVCPFSILSKLISHLSKEGAQLGVVGVFRASQVDD